MQFLARKKSELTPKPVFGLLRRKVEHFYPVGDILMRFLNPEIRPSYRYGSLGHCPLTLLLMYYEQNYYLTLDNKLEPALICNSCTFLHLKLLLTVIMLWPIQEWFVLVGGLYYKT